jgi:hypothetical protein
MTCLHTAESTKSNQQYLLIFYFILELRHFFLFPNLVDVLVFIFTFIILFVKFALWALAYGELSALNTVGHPAKQYQLPVCSD